MKNQRHHLVVFSILYSMFLATLSAGPLAASPPIKWQPEKGTITIGSGQGATEAMQITFESSRRLTDIRVEAVPELQPFVRMTPDHFAVVEAGIPQTVKLDFRLPPYASEGIYEGTIHVRQGKRTLPANLQLEVHVWYGGALIPPTTKGLSEETLDTLLSISEDGSTFTFAEGSPELSELNTGDILVFSVSEALPSGALREVIGTERSGGAYVVETIQASLEDAFESAEVDVVKVLTHEDLSAGTTSTAATLMPSKSPFGGFEIKLEDEVVFDADGSPSTDYDQIRMNGLISLETGFSFSLLIENGQVTEAELVDITTENVNLSFSSGVERSFEYEYEVAEYIFSPITIWVGWVPVIMTPTLSFNVGLNGDFSVSLEAGVTQQAELTIGAAYGNGNWSPMAELENDFQPQLPQVNGSALVRAWGGPTLGLLFYGVTGPTVDLIEYLEFDAELWRCPNWWQLWSGLQVDLTWKLDVLGRFPLGEISFPELVHLRELLAEAVRCECFELTLGYAGSGQSPLASPPNSADCPRGEYHAGEVIQLTARPATGWDIIAWSGTDDDASSAIHNTLTMPPSDHEVTVTYEQSTPVGPCLLFHSDRMGSMDVWMASLDGTQIRLTDKPGKESVGRVTPDGTKFAYYWDGNGDPGQAGLWLKELNGSSEVKLMSYFPQLGGLTAWSPDGTKFLYSWFTGSHAEVRIANLAGQDEGLFLAPTWPYTRVSVTGWRGGKILYEVGYSHSGNNRVFIANEDGTGSLELSRGDHGDLARFNSDGTRVSYFNHTSVMLVNSDGSGVNVLHENIGRTGYIPFLPDGNKVAVAAFTHDSKANDIYTIAIAEPHELTRITDTQDIYHVSDVAPRCSTGDRP